jgi:hypothetical protein
LHVIKINKNSNCNWDFRDIISATDAE